MKLFYYKLLMPNTLLIKKLLKDDRNVKQFILFENDLLETVLDHKVYHSFMDKWDKKDQKDQGKKEKDQKKD